MSTAQELFDKLSGLINEIQGLRKRLYDGRLVYCAGMTEFQGNVLDCQHMFDIEERQGALRDIVLQMVDVAADHARSLEQVNNGIGLKYVELDQAVKELMQLYNSVVHQSNERAGRVNELEARLKDHSPNCPGVRNIVWEMTGGKCFYCSEQLERDDIQGRKFHLDHIVAKANGGPDHISNYVPACEPCNISKGSKSFVEFTRKRAAQLIVIEGGQPKEEVA